MTEIIETQEEENIPIEGEVIHPNQKQKLFTSLTDMLNFIQAFRIESASFGTGYVQDDVGFVNPDKVFILNYISMNNE